MLFNCGELSHNIKSALINKSCGPTRQMMSSHSITLLYYRSKNINFRKIFKIIMIMMIIIIMTPPPDKSLRHMHSKKTQINRSLSQFSDPKIAGISRQYPDQAALMRRLTSLVQTSMNAHAKTPFFCVPFSVTYLHNQKQCITDIIFPCLVNAQFNSTFEIENFSKQLAKM